MSKGDFGVSRNEGPHPTLIVPVRFQNSGSTPTKNLIMHINWALIPQGVPEIPFTDADINGNTEAVMGPHTSDQELNAVIPEDWFKIAYKNSIRIRVWGWARYQDVFKGTPWHLTEYCYYLHFSGKSGTAMPEAFAFHNCLTHNCSDDQCKDYNPKGQPN